MKTHRIAATTGDGMGTEVIGACGTATTEEVTGATVAAIRDGGQNPGTSGRAG